MFYVIHPKGVITLARRADADSVAAELVQAGIAAYVA